MPPGQVDSERLADLADLTPGLLRRMFSVDRNGANCSKPAKLAAAKKISHDDDAKYELHALLLSQGMGVRIGES